MNNTRTSIEKEFSKGCWKNRIIEEADTQLPDFLSKGAV